MRVNNETIPKNNNNLIAYIFVAVIGALIFFGLLNAALNLFVFLLNLIIKYWYYPVLGILAFLILRKLLGKRKK